MSKLLEMLFNNSKKTANITINGTLNVSDDFIVSGFGYSNYFYTKNINYIPQVNDVVEMNLRYKCTEYYNWGVVLISFGTTPYNDGEVKDRSTTAMENGYAISGSFNINHSLGNWYRIRTVFEYQSGSNSKLDYYFSSDEGITWTHFYKTGEAWSDSGVPFNLNRARYGNCIENQNQYLRGEIDLKYTNIILNGNVLWQGVI